MFVVLLPQEAAPTWLWSEVLAFSYDVHVAFPWPPPFCITQDVHTSVTNVKRGHNTPMFPKYVLPSRLNFSYAFHSLNRSLHEFTIVSNWNIATFLKVDGRVLEHNSSV
jgi:hypothetical protein